ncbi:hypothetical protein GCM10023322_02540 [Rugosimonospora acidiphila]|uniref:Uncharacterized protein n=2 Tax=Rugosimonospora acidiphila TaxID=556531 RepID=A0ABP9RGW8_9ACTN
MRDGYVARWRGDEYEVSPDGDDMRLYSTQPRDGFEEIRRDRYRRTVPADEVSEFVYVRTTCYWRGEPFIMLGEHDSWLRVEYTGGKAPVAAELSLEEFDFGVYQGWVPAAEVTDVREQRV